MRVTRLDIQNLRIIREASVNTNASLVVLAGKNASGKTSFLEALNLLFYGRSFRTRHGVQLISHDADSYMVRSEVQQGEKVHSVGTENARRHQSRLRLDGEDVRPSDLIRRFPVQVIDAGIFDLVEGSPSDRRRFLDWGMFHVKHEFYPLWKRHRKIVSHCNALLRQRRSAELDPWKEQLASASESLAALREEYVVQLFEEVRGERAFSIDETAELGGGSIGRDPFDDEVELNYYRGWPDGINYADHLEVGLAGDIKERRIRSGAHLFDLTFRQGQKSVRDTFSRGQKKLYGLKLKLAQIKLYNSQSDKRCIVLVDDLAAEVDADNQRLAIKALLSSGSQVFLTGIDINQLRSVLPEDIDTKMFHVEHGVIKELH